MDLGNFGYFCPADLNLGGQAVKGRVKGAVKETDAGPVAYAVKRESAAACSTGVVYVLAMNNA